VEISQLRRIAGRIALAIGIVLLIALIALAVVGMPTSLS
jgi:hypothetical protein